MEQHEEHSCLIRAGFVVTFDETHEGAVGQLPELANKRTTLPKMVSKPLELDRRVFPFVALECVKQFWLFVCDFVKTVQAQTQTVKKCYFPTIPMRVSFQEADPMANLRVALENVE